MTLMVMSNLQEQVSQLSLERDKAVEELEEVQPIIEYHDRVLDEGVAQQYTISH